MKTKISFLSSFIKTFLKKTLVWWSFGKMGRQVMAGGCIYWSTVPPCPRVSEISHMVLCGAQLCSTLCDPMDCSPPGSSVHGTFQARMLEWVANCDSTLHSASLGTPLQHSCLENPMDGGAWWAAVHGIAEGRTRLSDFTFTFHLHALEKEMATHSSVPAWRTPGTGEPGALPSMGLYRVGHDWSDLAVAVSPF